MMAVTTGRAMDVAVARLFGRQVKDYVHGDMVAEDRGPTAIEERDAEVARLREIVVDYMAICDHAEQAIKKYRDGSWSGHSRPDERFAVLLAKVRELMIPTASAGTGETSE